MKLEIKYHYLSQRGCTGIMVAMKAALNSQYEVHANHNTLIGVFLGCQYIHVVSKFDLVASGCREVF